MTVCCGVLARPNAWQRPVIFVIVIILAGMLTWLGMAVAGVVAIIGAASVAVQRVTTDSGPRRSLG